MTIDTLLIEPIDLENYYLNPFTQLSMFPFGFKCVFFDLTRGALYSGRLSLQILPTAAAVKAMGVDTSTMSKG